MLHRLRSQMRFTQLSGLAEWCLAQMDVRYQSAVHIRDGESNEEAPENYVIVDGDEELFVCDLPLIDEQEAQDALNTLSDHNVLGQSLTLNGAGELSWVEYHQCFHGDDPVQPCAVVARNEGPA